MPNPVNFVQETTPAWALCSLPLYHLPLTSVSLQQPCLPTPSTLHIAQNYLPKEKNLIMPVLCLKNHYWIHVSSREDLGLIPSPNTQNPSHFSSPLLRFLSPGILTPQTLQNRMCLAVLSLEYNFSTYAHTSETLSSNVPSS